jgi:hypothetical protein
MLCQVQLGAERSAELSAIVNEFILRRTNSLLSAHLPPKVLAGLTDNVHGCEAHRTPTCDVHASARPFFQRAALF